MTLKVIMQGLEADMAAGAHGLWIDDREAVRVAASRIADHPHVAPEQMGVIQATLGDEFRDFARLDKVVHDAAVALADAAAGQSGADLMPGYIRIQEGCLACHAAFRPRVSEALGAPGG